jgi:N6-adenosine-specific RNA methylase IME4
MLGVPNPPGRLSPHTIAPRGDMEAPRLAGSYAVILADPPWHFRVRSGKGEGRSAKNHYGIMSLDDIVELPIAQWAAADCALFLWATDPLLPDAIRVLERWGFAYKTVGFHWAKTNKSGAGFFAGLGYWTRANPELCLLGTRGRPRRIAKDVRRLIVSPRREHSRKPDEVRDRIERLVPGPYLEVFARDTRVGWDSWGDEVGCFDEVGGRQCEFDWAKRKLSRPGTSTSEVDAGGAPKRRMRPRLSGAGC